MAECYSLMLALIVPMERKKHSQAPECRVTLSRKALSRAIRTWTVSWPHPGGCITVGIAAGWNAECNPTLLDAPADHGGE